MQCYQSTQFRRCPNCKKEVRMTRGAEVGEWLKASYFRFTCCNTVVSNDELQKAQEETKK